VWVFPEAAGDKAKVSLSFPDWKEGNVAPATFEVSIRKHAAKDQAPKVDLLQINRTIAKEPIKELERRLAAGDDRQSARAVEIDNLKALLQKLSAGEVDVAHLQVTLAALNKEWTTWQKERSKIQADIETLGKDR
jgi:predicted  nucleic acid-binding Zn-ribbon protein